MLLKTQLHVGIESSRKVKAFCSQPAYAPIVADDAMSAQHPVPVHRKLCHLLEYAASQRRP